MDIQIVLVFILALLTVNLLAVGIYVVLVLKELRQTIKTANNVLGSVESLSSVVSNPLTLLTGVVTAALQGIRAVKSIKSLHEPFDKEEDE